MIDSLRLKRFKNFQDATLRLGPLTVLLGANASGKSNIRDAFRFLHGIGLGYSLAEILGEKYVGGERIWSGIRGGTREVVYSGSDGFSLTTQMRYTSADSLSISPELEPPTAKYSIDVGVRAGTEISPRIRREYYHCDHLGDQVGFDDKYLLKFDKLEFYFLNNESISKRNHP